MTLDPLDCRGPLRNKSGMQDPQSQDALAAAIKASDFAGAERIVTAHLAARPDDVEALVLLLELQDRLKVNKDFAATVERLMRLAPERITMPRYRLLAKHKLYAGEPQKARAVLAQALAVYPDNLDLRIMHASVADDLAVTCDELEDVLADVGTDPVAGAVVLSSIAVYRALLSRNTQGLPNAAISWEDTCTWPDPVGLERFRRIIVEQIAATPRYELVLHAAGIATCDRQWDRAGELLERVRSQIRGTFADYAGFGSEFHAELDHFDAAAITRLLPPVIHILKPPPRSGETLLFASDPKYFQQFTLPFISAMDLMEFSADVQVHVMGGDPERWREMAAELDKFTHVSVGFSAENSGPYAHGLENIRLYCHAIRFVRLFDYVAQQCRPAWVFDVDVFVQRDPRPLLGRLADYDVAIRTNPCLITPPARVAGNLVGIAPTPRGLEYARRVAAYILYWKEKGTWGWGIDQVALYSAYAHMDRVGEAPKTYFQSSADASNDGDVDCVFYFPTGANKYIAGA